MEIIGINRIISTSKIKKITANKKKRIEKGDRVCHDGSKPHSNGEFFSRSLYDFLLIKFAINNKIILRNNKNEEKKI